jgi:hypothetical protein
VRVCHIIKWFSKLGTFETNFSASAAVTISLTISLRRSSKLALGTALALVALTDARLIDLRPLLIFPSLLEGFFSLYLSAAISSLEYFLNYMADCFLTHKSAPMYVGFSSSLTLPLSLSNLSSDLL